MKIKGWESKIREPQRRKLQPIENFFNRKDKIISPVDLSEINFFREQEVYEKRRTMKIANEKFTVTTE